MKKRIMKNINPRNKPSFEFQNIKSQYNKPK